MQIGNLEIVDVESRKALRHWLQRNHQRKDSVWLVRYKKGEARHVPWTEIVDEVLCFGWIDSQPRRLDESRSLLRLSPRNPKSAWSGINKAKVERLIADGVMTAAGEAVINLAKASGTWGALEKSDAGVLPDDLEKAFAKNKSALNNFEAFPKSTKRAILEWITQAKRAETRAARIQETVEKAANNERANQWQRKKV
jgi:uncharacterized protein YdeI (YjbR/CyaY-like superfamily)